MYEEVCQLGGLNEGIILAVKALGYTNPVIRSARDFKGDATRWAEFYLIIVTNVDEEHPIAFSILRKTIRQWKEVEAKDNYYMEYKTEVKEPHTGAFQRVDYKKFIYFYDYLKLDGNGNLMVAISLMQWYMVILHESDTCTGADTSSIPQAVNGILPEQAYTDHNSECKDGVPGVCKLLRGLLSEDGWKMAA